MRQVPSVKVWGPVAIAVALTAASLSMALANPEVNKQGSLAQALKKTILVFPVDVPSTSGPNTAEVSDIITDVVTSRLILSGTYSVTAFHKNLPPVARLRNDQRLLDVDVAPPFAEDNRKSIKIAKLIGYDVVFVGSMDEYQYDEAKKQVSVTLSGRLIESESGKVTKSVSLSATSPEGGAAKEDEKAVAAGRAAAEKLMAQVTPGVGAATQPGAQTQTPTTHKKSKGGGWLVALLLVGLGIGLGLSKGGGGGGSGLDLPPGPP